MKTEQLNKTQIKILKYILKRFNNDFYFISKNKLNIIKNILSNITFKSIISTNIDTINNEYINYYNKKYKKLIINNFIYNLSYISQHSTTIKKFIKNNNISKKNYNHTYEILKNISLSNVNDYNLILLFQNINDYEKQYFKNSTNIKTQTIEHFINTYNNMFQEYYNKKEAINILNL